MSSSPAAAFCTTELIHTLFGDSLSKFTSNLLCKICLDYNLDFKEVTGKYMDTPEGLAFFTAAPEPAKPEVELDLEEKKVKKTRKKRENSDTPKEPKRPCTGLTSKGTACTFAAAEGKELCGIHLRKLEGGSKTEKLPKEPKEPKKEKKVKTIPAHNHPLEEEDTTDCDLCASHGNAVMAPVTEKDFVAVTADNENIRDKLRLLVAQNETAEELAPQPAVVEPAVVEPEFSEEELEARRRVKQALEAQKAEEVVASKPKSFIRPKPKVRKSSPKPEDVASTSTAPVPDTTLFKKVLTWSDDADESEAADNKYEEMGEEQIRARLTLAMNDGCSSESEEEEMDFDQMCGSPDSQHRLNQAFAELDMEDEE